MRMPSTRNVEILRLQLMAARYKERVGERIKAAREARNWSQVRLARELPSTVDGATISRWETGKVEPRADNLQALADALGVDPSYFLVPEPKAGNGDLMGALRGPSQIDRLEAKIDDLTSMVNELLSQIAALELGATLEPEIPLPDEHIERRAATQARTTRSRAAS